MLALLFFFMPERREMNKFQTECDSLLAYARENARNPKDIRGLATPITAFNNNCGGIVLGEYTIIGARPGVGKSTIGFQLAFTMSETHNLTTLIVSNEMSVNKVLARETCRRARIPYSHFQCGLSNVALPIFEETLMQVRRLPVTIETGLNTGQIRQLIVQHNYKVVVIDYIQLLSSASLDNRPKELNDISYSLYNAAKDQDRTIIALSQAKRPVILKDGSESEPSMSDLEGAGIERSADNVYIMFQPGPDKRTIKVEKSRNFISGIRFDLKFHGEYLSFEDVE